MSSALPASRPKIVLLSLGGTIASAPATPGGGSLPTLTATDIAAGAPGAEQVAELVPVSFRQLPSSHLTLGDLVALAREIESRFADGFDAAVVTQGPKPTDSGRADCSRMHGPPRRRTPLRICDLTSEPRPAGRAGATHASTTELWL